MIIVEPFTKWGVYFTTYNPSLEKGHKYIISVVDYFTKWVKHMLTFTRDDETTTNFVFNHIIARFGIPREIVTDNGIHFQNILMTKLDKNLGFQQYFSLAYYPQEN